MTWESLEALNDEELQAVIARSQELLKRHDKERKDKALADARSILAGAGLSLRNVAKKGMGGKPVKPASNRSKHRGQHPDKA